MGAPPNVGIPDTFGGPDKRPPGPIFCDNNFLCNIRGSNIGGVRSSKPAGSEGESGPPGPPKRRELGRMGPSGKLLGKSGNFGICFEPGSRLIGKTDFKNMVNCWFLTSLEQRESLMEILTNCQIVITPIITLCSNLKKDLQGGTPRGTPLSGPPTAYDPVLMSFSGAILYWLATNL